MKSFFKLLLILVCSIIATAPMYAQGRPKKKVAVYMTGNNSNAAYKKVIGSKLVTSITESGEYAAVERTADFLAALAAENDYQTSGEVQDSQIARLGQRFGVKYVVVADASEIFDEYFIAARLINVETGLVEKAYDVSGPAESMAELIALSKNVAAGLLGRQLLNSTGNSNPIHLTLCVMDKYGVYKYITTEQWCNMPEGQKIDLTKLGVCISENGESFLLDCRELSQGSWQSANMPKKWQLELIYKYKVPLNNAMNIFGGDVIKDGWYWSCESVSSEKAIDLYMGDGHYRESNKSDQDCRRKVSALPN